MLFRGRNTGFNRLGARSEGEAAIRLSATSRCIVRAANETLRCIKPNMAVAQHRIRRWEPEGWNRGFRPSAGLFGYFLFPWRESNINNNLLDKSKFETTSPSWEMVGHGQPAPSQSRPAGADKSKFETTSPSGEMVGHGQPPPSQSPGAAGR